MKKYQDILNILNEYKSEGDTIITIQVSDSENSLQRMLEHIKSNSDGGHSFEVIVDPDGDVDQKKSFGIDGDGAFNIRNIKVSKLKEE